MNLKIVAKLALVLALVPVSLPGTEKIGLDFNGRAIAQETATRSGVILRTEGVIDEASQVLESDLSLYNEHQFQGQQGQRISIRMESGEVDAYLILFDPQGNMVEEADDVCNEQIRDCLNAALELELPANGVYTIYANTYGNGDRGRYLLTVQEN